MERENNSQGVRKTAENGAGGVIAGFRPPKSAHRLAPLALARPRKLVQAAAELRFLALAPTSAEKEPSPDFVGDNFASLRTAKMTGSFPLSSLGGYKNTQLELDKKGKVGIMKLTEKTTVDCIERQKTQKFLSSCRRHPCVGKDLAFGCSFLQGKGLRLCHIV